MDEELIVKAVIISLKKVLQRRTRAVMQELDSAWFKKPLISWVDISRILQMREKVQFSQWRYQKSREKWTMGKRDIEVLIVEDDLRIAEIQKRFIEQIEGFQTVGIAAGYVEAKTLIDILKPDLLLLDVYFPDMNGLELLKEIKLHTKQMDVIMITATKEIDKVQEAISIG